MDNHHHHQASSAMSTTTTTTAPSTTATASSAVFEFAGSNTFKALFPGVLHQILNDASTEGFEHIVSWNPDGNSFKIHQREDFMKTILPRYAVNQSKYKSFVRQLNIWGFSCVHGGRKNPLRGSYTHEYFVRANPDMCRHMERTKIKGNRKAKADKVASGQDSMRSSSSSSMMATSKSPGRGAAGTSRSSPSPRELYSITVNGAAWSNTASMPGRAASDISSLSSTASTSNPSPSSIIHPTNQVAQSINDFQKQQDHWAKYPIYGQQQQQQQRNGNNGDTNANAGAGGSGHFPLPTTKHAMNNFGAKSPRQDSHNFSIGQVRPSTGAPHQMTANATGGWEFSNGTAHQAMLSNLTSPSSSSSFSPLLASKARTGGHRQGQQLNGYAAPANRQPQSLSSCNVPVPSQNGHAIGLQHQPATAPFPSSSNAQRGNYNASGAVLDAASSSSSSSSLSYTTNAAQALMYMNDRPNGDAHQRNARTIGNSTSSSALPASGQQGHVASPPYGAGNHGRGNAFDPFSLAM
eukprot:CAMPEP_0119570508 /NCGR_PEP_ID=MMETSP1352-20130426/43651_1 /TAXON_ID=265584 /ORGANISM="Stauroneis constricta, Strain CCMP1120" /LENGTH=521 /DNA_ID=CAMNT_0007620177 /DNA_START=705 /DNA_END=2270 /DNA_ORIENTATION=-